MFAFLSFYAVQSPIQTTQTQWRKYRDKAGAALRPEEHQDGMSLLPVLRGQTAEERRRQLLSEDYAPGNEWWGSAVTP